MKDRRRQSTIERTMEILNRNVPNRMKLVDVVAWCMKKDMPNTANYFIGQMYGHLTPCICKDNVWYIDTAVLIVHFTVADNDKVWKQMECDVVTFVGLEA